MVDVVGKAEPRQGAEDLPVDGRRLDIYSECVCDLVHLHDHLERPAAVELRVPLDSAHPAR
jgi:hypothetical protein